MQTEGGRVRRRTNNQRLVHFESPQAAVLLTTGYPDSPPAKDYFVAGCRMPNPDIGPYIIEGHRQRHMADYHPPKGSGFGVQGSGFGVQGSAREPDPRHDPRDPAAIAHRPVAPQTMDDLIYRIHGGPIRQGGLGRDVLLLAAGPSVGEQLLQIKMYAPHALVVALNRSVAIQALGDVVDVFFCLERQSRPEWWTNVNPELPVVVCPSTHGGICDHFPPSSRYYTLTPWCVSDKWPDAPPWALDLPTVPCCETTISACLAFCARLKPNRIILVGCDHAHKAYVTDNGESSERGEYYYDGTTWEETSPGLVFHPGGVIGINDRQCIVSAWGERHCRVTTACCEQIELQTGIQVINASSHGILRHRVMNGFLWRENTRRRIEATKKAAVTLNERFLAAPLAERGRDSAPVPEGSDPRESAIRNPQSAIQEAGNEQANRPKREGGSVVESARSDGGSVVEEGQSEPGPGSKPVSAPVFAEPGIPADSLARDRVVGSGEQGGSVLPPRGPA